jgi:hypothetical protein
MSSFINQSLFVRVGSLEDTIQALEPFMFSGAVKPIDTTISIPCGELLTPKPPILYGAVEERRESDVPTNSILYDYQLKTTLPIPCDNIVVRNESEIPKSKESVPKNLFFSDKEDTLFWAIYIHVYGYAAYLDISTKYKNVELAEKQKIMVHLKANAASMYKTGTTHKLTNVDIQEIMSELMTNRKTSLFTIYALAVYYKVQITLVKDKMYHEYVLSSGERGDECVLYYRHGRYGIYLQDQGVPVFDRNAAIRLETIYKPLKGASFYKMGDLEQLYAKVGGSDLSLNVPKKWKKADLYNAIVEKLVW